MKHPIEITAKAKVEADIDLAALQHNCNIVRRAAPHSRIMAAVKANAYGHGLIRVAQALHSVDSLAVARLEEALTLIEHDIRTPLVLLSEQLSSAELELCAEKSISIVIHNPEGANNLITTTLSQPIDIWLKLDSGMHRLGFQPPQFPVYYQQLKTSANVSSIKLMTHFSSANETQNPLTNQQQSCFEKFAQPLKEPMSLANSAAILAWPNSHKDWVRPGIMLYGADPLDSENTLSTELKPVMNLYARLIAIRNIDAGESVGYNGIWTSQRSSTIATIAAGYADGYPRHARSGTPVLIKNQRVPLVGRVSMDMISVDITDHPDIVVGDKALLWGELLSVNEVAQYSDTISYELLTGVSSRVKFNYLNDR